jgi:hypothetical protein
METIKMFKLTIDSQLKEENLRKGAYISVIHASRIPPHIGMIFNNKYHSLSIKGQEVNQSVDTLIKNSKIRKIPSLFIKIKKHPSFSNEYLNEHFISDVSQFNRVESGKTTCLSPVKCFFEEAYGLSLKEVNYIFELLPELEKHDLIEATYSLFVDNKEFELPLYTFDEINKEIEAANNEIKKIKSSQYKN